MKLLTATEVRDVARRYGIRPSRALGQNFLIDGNTVRKILRVAEVGPVDQVVEVGAGLGTLTVGLAQTARRVIAIEIDRAIVPALREVVAPFPNVELVAGDALGIDYGALLRPGRFRFVANLPYNIATPLLARLLSEVPQIEDFVVMIQREVGERLVASPGSRTYGAVSVLVAYHCGARLLGRVPPAVFWPPPRVESVIVRLLRRPPPVAVPAGALMGVVRAAFSQRRKTLRNALASALDRPPDAIEAVLRRAGVDPRARAEELSLQRFASIAEALG